MPTNPETTADMSAALKADLDTLTQDGRSRVRAELLEIARRKGWTLRECGELFGITHQRVSQILRGSDV